MKKTFIFLCALFVACCNMSAGNVMNNTDGWPMEVSQSAVSVVGKWQLKQDGQRLLLDLRQDGTGTMTFYLSMKDGRKVANVTIMVPTTWELDGDQLYTDPDDTRSTAKWGTITGFSQREIREVKSMSGYQVLQALCGGASASYHTIVSASSTKIVMRDEDGSLGTYTKVVK